ncbi:hypothetical protein DV515_00017781 [Chloebia gouldiae]|uniref:Leptin n=1 Tax=Chloebia gouldiae TaxID=44316 RepID=A0A3L8Q9J6_CHLGU|nr:hypothetical protein DV515_00017781 [Chloebia gouldiae]
MRCPGVSLWGLLCLAVAVAGGRPVRLEGVRADARALTRTLSTRLQQLQVTPARGTAGTPGEGGRDPAATPPEGTGGTPRPGGAVPQTRGLLLSGGGSCSPKWGGVPGGVSHDGDPVPRFGGSPGRGAWGWVGVGALIPNRASPGRESGGLHPQLFPLTLRITGLEGIPEGGLPDGGLPPGLGWAAQQLQLFQRLLGALAGGDLRLAQVANDLENLRSLLAVLGALLGCPPARDPAPAPPAPLAEAPHTVAGVALARLRGCLDRVAACLEGVPAC